jgi:uncharacterized oxidoreductase
MRTTGNTMLITGGGTGIGRGLAGAFYALGNQVVIAGRRRAALEATAAAHPGMAWIVADVATPAGVRALAAEVLERFPALDVLVNNAGIMRAERLLEPQADLADPEAIVATNLLGPLRLTAALMPHLRARRPAAILNVSSGLAFVPMALTPTYSATKAGLHAWTETLRWQLQDTGIEVLELIPPYVATDLMDGADDPRAMPLKDFIAETMKILVERPEAREICVEQVKRLRFAAQAGTYDAMFQGLNAAMGGGRK